MAEAFADPAVVKGYHAHLYYAPPTRPIAERLRAAIAERFPPRGPGSAAGMTSRSGLIRYRCIRSPSRSRSSHSLCPG